MCVFAALFLAVSRLICSEKPKQERVAYIQEMVLPVLMSRVNLRGYFFALLLLLLSSWLLLLLFFAACHVCHSFCICVLHRATPVVVLAFHQREAHHSDLTRAFREPPLVQRILQGAVPLTLQQADLLILLLVGLLIPLLPAEPIPLLAGQGTLLRQVEQLTLEHQGVSPSSRWLPTTSSGQFISKLSWSWSTPTSRWLWR